MDFVISIIYWVADPFAAAAFLCNHLGFQQKQSSDHGIVVDNRAVAIRLTRLSVQNQEALNLELQSQNLGKTTEALLKLPNVSLIGGKISVGGTRVENRLQGPHGIIITVSQEFNEDQLGVMPPLPASLIWDEKAENAIRQLLRFTPVHFRDVARIRITEQAEMLAAAQASITVNLDYALQALAELTPHFQHPLLISALQQMEIEPTAHFQRTVS
jgi:hypothetical protein